MKHFILMRWNLPGSLHYSSVELVSDPVAGPETRAVPAVLPAERRAADGARFAWFFFVCPDAMSEEQGFYYDVMRDEMRHVQETQNAFVTLLEPVEGVRTAWGWPHHKIGEDNEIL